ncbi:MAG TPA: hypothetical protein VJZ27_20125, partial [Aggregatilineales bacterium]|nr:hypothetical protein [Aggregatilineales bacterium]
VVTRSGFENGVTSGSFEVVVIFTGEGGGVSGSSPDEIREEYTGEIDDANPFILFPIDDVPEGANITIEVTTTGGDLDPLLGLIYEEEVIAASDENDRNTGYAFIDYSDAEGGDYSVVVTREGIEDGETSGSFELVVMVSGEGVVAVQPTRTPTSSPTASSTPEPTQTATPTPTATQLSVVVPVAAPPWIMDLSGVCDAPVLAARLVAGERGQVLPEPPVANILRRDANVSSAKIGEIQPGEFFDVISDPVCSGGLNRWQVMLEDGMIGWTSEGDQTGYWTAPIDETNIWTERAYAGECAGISLSPRLLSGQLAVVLHDDSGVALNSNPARPSTDASTDRLETINPGEVFRVLGGPICNNRDGIVWWRVNYHGIVGWTGEGENSAYWI